MSPTPIPPALVQWRTEIAYSAYPGGLGPDDLTEPVTEWHWAILDGPDAAHDIVIEGMSENRDPTPALNAIVNRHNAGMDDYDIDRLVELEDDLAELLPIVLDLDHLSTEGLRRLGLVLDDAEFAGAAASVIADARDALALVKAAASAAHTYGDRLRDGQYSGLAPARSAEFERLAQYNAAVARGETFPPGYVARMRLAQLRFDARELERAMATYDWVVCVPGGGYLCGNGDVPPPDLADVDPDNPAFIRLAGFNGNVPAVADALDAHASGEYPAVTDDSA